MIKASERNNSRGILSRLLRDQKGNTIAIMAAAVLPTIGLVGGAVDISRIYLAKVKLQAACDAGSLMGRKVMGTGGWTTATAEQAEKIFNHNYRSGAYGTTGLTKSFSESAGNVTGIAGVNVPVSILRPALVKTSRVEKVAELKAAFVTAHSRQPTEAEVRAMEQVASNHASAKDYGVLVQTSCQSQMAIPNTDVMFVLDVTGSMDDDNKLPGLKVAVKCFFESLQKEDITTVTPTQCGTTANPTAGNAADISVRFGFVPYATNVNVGKLLPLDFIANNWTYQSRQAQWTPGTGYDAVYGAETTATEYGTPTVTTGGGWGSSWNDVSGSSIVVNGQTYYRRFDANNASECTASGVTPPEHTVTSTGNLVEVSRNPATPVHPTTTSVTVNYEKVSGSTDYQYQYEYNSRRGRCQLQYKSRVNASTTQYFSSTIPVTWELNQTFSHYIYKPTPFNVSGLKNTASNAWRNSVSLPLGSSGVARTANWDGCIEERQTARVNDSDPSDNWSPVPAGAKDMDIDLVATTADPTTQWGPILDDVVYARYWDGTATTNEFTSDQLSDTTGQTKQIDAACPAPAKLYQEWTPTNFDSYVSALTADSYTYHDIGLLWGARLMSPTGIFGSLTAPADRDIQRHMVFMTDGDTNANPGSTNYYGGSGMYTAYGIDYWDRRQNDGTSNPAKSWLDDNIDARTQAICDWVKAKNITLWVIAFGSGVNQATKDRLALCASPGKSYSAADNTALTQQFNAIAAEISLLRLTS
jgi:Putative Flp pilus-assembly TadE/G-like